MFRRTGMKLFENCLNELFDFDVKCNTCNSNALISKEEYEKIKCELLISDSQKRTRLLRMKKYNAVYNHMADKGGFDSWKSLDNDDKNINRNEDEHSVTCPYCKSTDTQKILGLSKAGSVALFGIFSQKVKKQWHCNHCKSDF